MILKFLFCVFCSLGLVRQSLAQFEEVPPARCPVGGRVNVYQGHDKQGPNCSYPFHAFESLDGAGLPLDGQDTSFPFFVGQNQELLFEPFSAGTFSDTIKITYGAGGGLCDNQVEDILHVTGQTFFDSTLRFRQANYYVDFVIDSLTNRYRPMSVPAGQVFIFNNRPDAVTLDSCILTIDSSAHMSLRTLIDSVPFAKATVDPFSQATLGFRLTHTGPIFPEDRTILAMATIHAYNSAVYTEVNFSFWMHFSSIKNGVATNVASSKFDPNIFPNPSNGPTQLSLCLKKRGALHLHIFNELGKDILPLYDGTMTDGRHDFSFTLPQGMYYVRMETSEGVVTKRVIVE
ncbi:MAG: T9SS type A sorting domain-containing protein [Bacteroidota bacterium]|nr:T9SS type A sorting domain-containing protein [Bacteroidota bacterium]